jgi:hypothetical protein
MDEGRDIEENDGRCLGTMGERRVERLLTPAVSGAAPGRPSATVALDPFVVFEG